MPPASPYLEAARVKDVPVTSEIRLFIERCPARIVGVTGTKGKSTTTALLGQMLGQKHVTHVGGNIGGSLLFELPNIRADDLVVLELSSFMLEYLAEAKWSPHAAVVTMIAADHLDRHGTKEAYVEAKLNLVRFQRAEDVAVLNETCPDCEMFARATAARKVYFGLEGRKPFELKIPGWHNQLNAQAAFAAAGLFGVSWDDAQRAVADFRGLAHRLELVHERDGVWYFNDSIATIPEAAIAALTSFPPRSVIQIVGGYDKKLDMTAMCAALVERAKAVLCIGQTGPAIASALEQSPKLGAAACYACGDLATAMKVARGIAAAGDVVLLSPGCASYDQFANFEARGRAFAQFARSAE
jgi:UDP-N-acetylmuramoylalanine--D-glutamate ligase